MFNKSIAFGLLAAGLMIAPSAAVAQQRQDNVQINEQSGAAVNGSVNTQTSDNINIQKQVQQRRGRYLNRYGVCGGVGTTSQTQNSSQVTAQSGAAIDGSINEQSSTSTNVQTQSVSAGRVCR